MERGQLHDRKFGKAQWYLMNGPEIYGKQDRWLFIRVRVNAAAHVDVFARIGGLLVVEMRRNAFGPQLFRHSLVLVVWERDVS